ncbi:biotin (acetyl-CoA carboxylase) synthetase [Halothermothrix orenii H 168]|uniref:Biotin (Acetyl-CoA carboxylase) synthetase n=1 Tax=Halothermothrix orenii (strain H 168 / OCM 544 / DSM 9562) TaxID=373903 RepID=B8D104_HALOH|nr:adenylyl-sulfate reductase subunit alpha [Halothermothrix orenii]ACL68973.1 biotin (acetyl-CoA carboxylase) synthetase [Halothermothrix orenii H 168]
MKKKDIEVKVMDTDLLIIGGGTAGCMAAIRAKELDPDVDVLIMEKAHIRRSGCLASGMNAINAYLNPGETPESFVRYVRADAMGLVREDLLLGMARRLNQVVHKVESWGLPIEKDKQGNYVPRGRWNIKINGESLKPIIADKAIESGARVLNRVTVTNLITTEDGSVMGAMGFGIRDGVFYVVKAGATIVATGGAAGIYKPNNDGSAHHKMWYSPFNTGAGYAIGIRAGAEMTSFEMRFIALRTKDVIAPTGTLALGFGATQVNARGERFMAKKFRHLGSEGAPTPIRVYGPTREIKEGRGPVFMDTTHLSEEEVRDLKKSYLNMYPDIVLFWAANKIDPGQEPLEIQGTEPYLVGGHAQAGYWITEKRETTLPGLYAAGDVAGGAPYKFVSGAWAEGEIAAENALEYLRNNYYREDKKYVAQVIEREIMRVYAPLRRRDGVKAEEMEERLQKIMDQYAGGVSRYYEMNEDELKLARKLLKKMRGQVKYLRAEDYHKLMLCHEVLDRLDVASVLVEHLLYRRETRWPAYQSRVDYPDRNDREWLKFVNSRLEGNKVSIIERPYKQIVPGDRYLP